MPKKKSRDGSKLVPTVIRLEVRYSDFFGWFMEEFGATKVDTIRDSVEEYFVENGGSLEQMGFIVDKKYNPETSTVTVGDSIEIKSYTKGLSL